MALPPRAVGAARRLGRRSAPVSCCACAVATAAASPPCSRLLAGCRPSRPRVACARRPGSAYLPQLARGLPPVAAARLLALLSRPATSPADPTWRAPRHPGRPAQRRHGPAAAPRRRPRLPGAGASCSTSRRAGLDDAAIDRLAARADRPARRRRDRRRSPSTGRCRCPAGRSSTSAAARPSPAGARSRSPATESAATRRVRSTHVPPARAGRRAARRPRPRAGRCSPWSRGGERRRWCRWRGRCGCRRSRRPGQPQPAGRRRSLGSAVLAAVYAADAGPPRQAMAFTAAALLADRAPGRPRRAGRGQRRPARGPHRRRRPRGGCCSSTRCSRRSPWSARRARSASSAPLFFDPHPRRSGRDLARAPALHLLAARSGAALALLLHALRLARGVQAVVVVLAVALSGRLPLAAADGPLLAAWGDRPGPVARRCGRPRPALLAGVLVVVTARSVVGAAGAGSRRRRRLTASRRDTRTVTRAYRTRSDTATGRTAAARWEHYRHSCPSTAEGDPRDSRPPAGRPDPRALRRVPGRLEPAQRRGVAAGFADDGDIVGFDGSTTAAGCPSPPDLRQVFGSHADARLRRARSARSARSPTASPCCMAHAGMIPPGGNDFDPDLHACTPWSPSPEGGRWKISLFQATPAAWHRAPRRRATR